MSSEVVDGEVLAEEDVTNNPELLSAGEVDIHTSESANAGAAGVEDVVGTLEGVWLAAEIEGELREGGNLFTRKRVLAVPKSAWHQSPS